ncbi:hypothetical protein BKA83DRAFT_90223, partial [Pisolithus microcarpus]
RFTNGDLPPLFLKGRKWAKLFLPTLLLWIGDQPNVWSVPEDNLVHALTEIAKVVYPTFNTLDDIRPNMPIFAVVRVLFLCDTVLMCCIGKSTPVFAYEDLDSSSADKAFHGAFVLQLLANAHLRSCAGSVDVPPLGLTPKTYKARGAIALCVTAVSHRYYMAVGPSQLLMHVNAARACHQANEVQVRFRQCDGERQRECKFTEG